MPFDSKNHPRGIPYIWVFLAIFQGVRENIYTELEILRGKRLGYMDISEFICSSWLRNRLIRRIFSMSNQLPAGCKYLWVRGMGLRYTVKPRLRELVINPASLRHWYCKYSVILLTILIVLHNRYSICINCMGKRLALTNFHLVPDTETA